MIYPEFLKQGDLIDVPAPSGGAKDSADKTRIKSAKEKIEALGGKVEVIEVV